MFTKETGDSLKAIGNIQEFSLECTLPNGEELKIICDPQNDFSEFVACFSKLNPQVRKDPERVRNVARTVWEKVEGNPITFWQTFENAFAFCLSDDTESVKGL